MRPLRPPGLPTRLALTLMAVLTLTTGCDREGGGATQPTASPSPTTEVRGYSRFSAPAEIGRGFLVAMSLDGSAAYVSDTDEAFPEPGCEGQPEPVLFRQPLAGGPRELLKAGESPVKGSFVRGPDGLVALVGICEEFFTGLSIGRESPEGRITELREVRLELPEGEGIPAAFGFSWTPDGRSLLAAINDPAGPDGNPSSLVRIDPATGAVQPLFSGEGGSGIFQFGQLKGGTYVVASNRVVTFRDAQGQITASFPGNGFEFLPDRTGIVVYGEMVAVATEGSTEARTIAEPRPDHEISSTSVSPDGEAVAFNRYALSGSNNEIAVVTVDDAKTSSIVAGEGYGRPTFSGDGGALGFNQFVPAPDFSAILLLARAEG